MMMSIYSYASFLQQLLAGRFVPTGPCDADMDQVVKQPLVVLQDLLVAHLDALLAGWPGGSTLRPAVVPATTFWVGAVLQNMAWAGQQAAARPLAVSMRLVQALPPAADLAAMLAYHSLLRYREQIVVAPDWQVLWREVLLRSPLSAAWFLHPDVPLRHEVLVALLTQPPLRAALRDRWLALAPDAREVRHGLTLERAGANAALGIVLGQLLAAGDAWRPFVLSFYEAECTLLRRGDDHRPEWPLLTHLRAARNAVDPRQRRLAERTLIRYRPLRLLMHDEAALRPYLYLDVRFLEQIADAQFTS